MASKTARFAGMIFKRSNDKTKKHPVLRGVQNRMFCVMLRYAVVFRRQNEC